MSGFHRLGKKLILVLASSLFVAPAFAQSVDGTPSGAAAWNACWILKNRGFRWDAAIQMGISPSTVLAGSMSPMPPQMNRNYQELVRYIDALKGLPDAELKPKSDALTKGTIRKALAMCPGEFSTKERTELKQFVSN